MKPKQWLKDNGHITEIGRGRLSRDHIALIEQAVRNGATIEGYAVSTATAASTTSKPDVERVKVDSTRVADVPDEIRSEQAWQAHTMKDGKKVHVGMREVCEGCKNSLTYCFCRTSVTREGVIIFSARTTPFKRPW